MTNREKLAELSTEDFWQEINRISKHKATVYIDYVKFLDSEDSDISHFIRNEGECLVAPSETEKLSAKHAGMSEPKSRHALFLRERKMYDAPYAVVFMDNEIYTVPFEKITMLD